MTIIPWEQHEMQVVGDVANGMAALELLEETVVDLMIVDLQMPVMDGFDLIKACKLRYPRMQYIVLTFHEDFEYVQQAMRLGAIDYLSKVRLEEENLNDVLTRAARTLRRLRFDSPGEEELRPAMPDALFDSLEEEWAACQWIYDEDQHDVLDRKMQHMHIPFRDLNRIGIGVEHYLKSAYGYVADDSLDRVSTTDELIRYFRSLKRSLLEYACSSMDLNNSQRCILMASARTLKRLGSNLRTVEVASEVGMSRSYFSTSFKRITGINYIEFLQQHRVRLAERLLQETDLTISEITRQAGYEDEKYFGSLFSRYYDVDIEKYRESILD